MFIILVFNSFSKCLWDLYILIDNTEDNSREPLLSFTAAKIFLQDIPSQKIPKHSKPSLKSEGTLSSLSSEPYLRSSEKTYNPAVSNPQAILSTSFTCHTRGGKSLSTEGFAIICYHKLVQKRGRCRSVTFFQILSAVSCVFIKVLTHMDETLSGRLRELKNNEKVQLGNPKGGRGRLRERSLTRAFK